MQFTYCAIRSFKVCSSGAFSVFTESCSHWPRKKPCRPAPPQLPPQLPIPVQPWLTADLLSVSIYWPVLDVYINGITCYVCGLCAWLLPLSIVIWRCSHAFVCISPSVADWFFTVRVWTTFCVSIHQLIDTGVVFTFWLLWIILVWMWTCKYVFEFLLSFLLVIFPDM